MSRSDELLARAQVVIPGGVNSPVRAFRAVGGSPPFIERGEGAEIIDVEGNRYIDLVGSWGALLIGHAEPRVLGAAMAAAARGSSFGAPTEAEIQLAELICARYEPIEQVRLCSSGTEATMHAIRLARGFTSRDLVIKLEGCYHGAHDSMLVEAGSGLITFAMPGSAGVPEAVAALTLVAPFNDLAAIEAHFVAHPTEIAAIILEPVTGNMGVVLPQPGYLEGLRALCDKYGALLIFDEVMCGFRIASGGVMERFGVRPDLVCLGKIVGGGYPLAAFGGRRDVMQHLSPIGPVYQAGTLSGNPVAVAAGIATLQQLDAALYARLEALGQRLEDRLKPALGYHGCSLARCGSMFTIFFRDEVPQNFAEAKESDTEAFARFFQAGLDMGVYLPPSQFEAVFLSGRLEDAHMDSVIDGLEAAIVRSLGD